MTARHRDIAEQAYTLQAIEPQQIANASSDVNGDSIDLQSYDFPQSAEVVVMFNSADNNDDIDFAVEESSDNSSWSKISGATANGLSGDNASANIALSNLQDNARYIRVMMESDNSSLNSANAELSAAIVLYGSKTL